MALYCGFSTACKKLKKLIRTIQRLLQQVIGTTAAAVLVMAALFSNTAVHADAGDWIVKYETPENDEEEALLELLQGEYGIPDMVSYLESQYRLKKPVYLQVGADEGPHYEVDNEIITIPYHYAAEIYERFDKYGDESRIDMSDMDEIALDVIFHTLLHELGHALMAQYNYPLFFEEEDVVDALSNYLLLEYTEFGAQVAVSAAEMFWVEQEDLSTYEADDFWGEHSLEIQRAYDVYCAIVGAYPDDSDHIVDSIFEGDEDKAYDCIENYERIRAAWEPLLEPVIIRD